MKYSGIIFSGLPGSGKTTASRQLAPLLNWPIVYIGGLWREQHKQLYPNNEVSFADYFVTTTLEQNKEMDQRVREMLEAGNVIGDMRHDIIAEGLPFLRVFISAPLEIRAQRGLGSEQYTGKTVEEVMKILKEREDNEVRVAQQIYGEWYDFRDPSRYHLVLNSGLLSVDEKINSVLHFFKESTPS